MNFFEYEGKQIRLSSIDGKTYEGKAEIYYDEDGTEKNYLMLPFQEKNCLVIFDEKDIEKIEILSD